MKKAKKKTSKNELRIIGVINKGFTRTTVRKKLKEKKINVSRKEFDRIYKENSTTDVLVKRFQRARLNTKITFIFFKKARRPEKLRNNFVVLVRIRINGPTTGESESKLLVGYDRTIQKKTVLRKIEEAIEELRRRSPDIDVDFLAVEGLFAKKGRF